MSSASVETEQLKCNVCDVPTDDMTQSEVFSVNNRVNQNESVVEVKDLAEVNTLSIEIGKDEKPVDQSCPANEDRTEATKDVDGTVEREHISIDADLSEVSLK